MIECTNPKDPMQYPKCFLFVALSAALTAMLQAASVSEQILVNQIGYRPGAEKWIMVADPQVGQNQDQHYVPGSSLQLRRSSDDAVVASVPLTAWNAGAVHASSGDRVWQGHFSDVSAPGRYYLWDPHTGQRSWEFEIGESVYNGMLQAAVKSYYYQRSGTAIPSAFGGQWTHGPAHLDNQLQARLHDASMGGVQGPETARDVTGGWYDAGDYRKYTSWMADIIWDLGMAYEWWPAAFGDASNIPESGNGVPDILDEIKWEVDWMLKMQREDGALYSGVFVITSDQGYQGGIGDPSTENRPYYYANISTSATASGASSFAIAAQLFAPFDAVYPGYSSRLRQAAEQAWRFLEAHPGPIHYDHNGFDNADANKSDSGDLRMRIAAAAALFRLTGASHYRDFVDMHHADPNAADGGHQPIIRGYFETGASMDLQRGLVTYALSEGATEQVVTTIKASLEQGIRQQPWDRRHEDPYKCFMWDGHYTWSSNGMKAHWAMLPLWGVKLGVNVAMSDSYQRLAEEYLHYYHGRNPLGWTYLTQAQLFGADKPITRIYHGWFHEGTVWEQNPAPGILAGGPNQYYEPDASYRGVIDPPQNQPPMKSYRDWNTSWPENSWSVTENSTGYQSRYIFLMAAFAAAAVDEEPSTNAPEGIALAPLYRFHRKDNNSHFFTAVEAEKEAVLTNLSNDIWTLEGISHHVILSQPQGALPVYRLFNRRTGSHFYTLTVSERDQVLTQLGHIFSLEGVAFFAFSGAVQGAQPVYRFYAAPTGSHFFTISEAEKDWIIANIPTSRLEFEGVAWWAFP